MASVAESAFAAVFAAAEVNGAIFFSLVLGGGEFTALVCTVAEGLVLALAAGAPVIGLAGLDRGRVGAFLGAMGLAHGLEN